ncbi:MAG: hypothetical protein ACJ790_06035 [Myxococcaceae bacterium]
MGLVEKDFIVRMIEQFAKLLAAALKLRQQGKNDEALEAIHRCTGELYGLDWDVLAFSDPQTAAGLLAGKDRIRGYARLLEEESITLRMLGRVLDADRARDRASAVYREILKKGADPESEQAIARLG